MNRLSFLKKFGALVGCFWVAPHIPSEPVRPPVCPLCGGMGSVLVNTEPTYLGWGHFRVESHPCPECGETDKERYTYYYKYDPDTCRWNDPVRTTYANRPKIERPDA